MTDTVFRDARPTALGADAGRPSSAARRFFAGSAVIAVLMSLLFMPATPQVTLAAWNDAEVGSAPFAATTAQAPTTIGCSVTNGLGLVFASVTLTWTFPAGSTYSSANASLGAATTVNGLTPLSPQPVVSGPNGGGTYSATFSRAALTGLLGGVLDGTTFAIAVRTNLNGWTSVWMPASVTVGPLGLGSSCTPGPLALSTATQSSQYNTAAASRAIDGNINGAFFSNSVTHTNSQASAWWRAQLSSSQAISQIRIYNRTDCCGDRLTDYWVFVSASPFNTALTPAQQAVTPGVWSSRQTTTAGSPTVIPVGVTGRYVMVQLNTTNFLSLTEVQLFH